MQGAQVCRWTTLKRLPVHPFRGPALDLALQGACSRPYSAPVVDSDSVSLVRTRVYIETSMVSYLVARPSRDVVAAAHQQISLDWWEGRRKDFDLCTSQLVLDEAGRGDPKMARRRLEILEDIALLEVSDEAQKLAVAIVQEGLLPQTAFPDALHIAISTTHQVDYLLTWNCSHIANAEILPRVAAICERTSLALPYVCTPEELLGDPQ